MLAGNLAANSCLFVHTNRPSIVREGVRSRNLDASRICRAPDHWKCKITVARPRNNDGRMPGRNGWLEMIDRDEIESMAASMAIDTSHVQRDYVHGWVLSCLFKSSRLCVDDQFSGRPKALRDCLDFLSNHDFQPVPSVAKGLLTSDRSD
jgi:hypothetical protein